MEAAQVDWQRQAVEINGSPGVFKSGLLLRDEKQHLVTTMYQEVSTLYHAFLRGMQASDNGRCLGERTQRKEKDAKHTNGRYKFIDYAEVFKRSQEFGSALISKLGLLPRNTTNVAVYARNCPEWFITALACTRYSMVVVPLYDTLGAEAATFILEHTEAEVVIVDDAKKAQKLLEFTKETPKLKHVVLIEHDDSSTSLSAIKAPDGIEVHSFSALRAFGREHTVDDVEARPEDTYIICYTSGTTGTPKGVVLTHANVVSNISAFGTMLQRFLPDLLVPPSSLLIISYLPLSHMMEQCMHWCTLMFGGAVGYFSGDVADLSDDMQALQPTVFPVVPRLLNRFNDTIHAQVKKSGKLGKLLYDLAYSQKVSGLRQGVVTNSGIWDKIVFRKAQAQLGGKVRLIITGSAPISAEVLESCRVAFGAHIVEGYGQTECTALCTSTWAGESTGGHCGGPAVCSNIKLEDVPELNYFSKDRKGEILVKGPSVTKGYYKDAEKTAELFDKQGFLRTGDIGHLLDSGVLRIIDRKKHIFKLAQGEYVAPEKIESVYTQSHLVQQIFVDGDSLERFLIAIVVPAERPLFRLFEELHPGAGEKCLEDVCCDEKVIAHLLKDLQGVGKARKLNSIEQVKAVYLEPEPFSVENGLLTPTLKSKRPQLRLKYTEVMKNLYGKKL